MNSTEDSPSAMHDSEDPDEIVVSTRCKKCEIGYTRATILKHISHSKPCKDCYTKVELVLLKDWAKEKKGESKKRSYDPDKRKKIYLQLKRKNQLHGTDKVILNISR